MKMQTLNDLYLTELHDLYDAENQILKALPKMAESASSAELRSAFQEHLDQTRTHVARLEEIFTMHGEKIKGEKCAGIEGILKEGKELMDEDAQPMVRDAALIAAAQRVEHYEIAVYGCVRTYAQQLGFDRAANLLQTTLREEEQTDKKLTGIAESRVNVEATRTAGGTYRE
ncbi:MAG TPA: ferritin-like domain-containing protein [Solibacterales bacterium]|nr:ferritin-like domain-containing protein [Bryobacterales bacterium]